MYAPTMPAADKLLGGFTGLEMMAWGLLRLAGNGGLSGVTMLGWEGRTRATAPPRCAANVREVRNFMLALRYESQKRG